MYEHRSTHPGVSKSSPAHKQVLVHAAPFSPADALESLHTEVVQLEAFAHVAAEIIGRMSPPANQDQRRDYIRLYALVTRVAEDALAAVERGDEMIAALSAYVAGTAALSSE